MPQFYSLGVIGNACCCANRGIQMSAPTFGNKLTTVYHLDGGNTGAWLGGVTFGTIGSACYNSAIGVNSNTAGVSGDEITKAHHNGQYGVAFNTPNNRVTRITANSNPYGILFGIGGGNYIGTLNTTGNTSGAIATDTENGRNYIGKATMAETTKVGFLDATTIDDRVYVNNIGGYSVVYCRYGQMASQTATARSGWRPRAGPYAVVANKAMSFSAYIKKSHGTDIEAKLFVRGGQLSGVDNDVTATAPSNTSRNSVALANFTPTEAGVIEVEMWSYWLANAATQNAIIDDVTVTQAA